MKKRMLSMLLVMLLVFSLLPAAALAADPVNPAQADAADLHMTKNLALAADGTYTLTLESWATGTEHSEKVIKPMDIVLVLDQSGSMEDSIPIPPTEADRVSGIGWQDVRDGAYYVKVGDEYYILHAFRVFAVVGYLYFVYYNDGNSNHYLMSWHLETEWAWHTSNPTLTSDYAYYLSHGSQPKLTSLKNAVNDFITAVSEQKNEDGSHVDHRVAVVGFANDDVVYSTGSPRWLNTEVFDGEQQTQYDEINGDSDILLAALKNTDENGVEDLRASVTALESAGGTCSDKGLDLAKQILDARSTSDKETRGCVVLMFTDGLPGDGSSTSGNRSMLRYANLAVGKAYELKHQNDATVFSVGIFNTVDSNQDDTASIGSGYEVKDYMVSVGSDFPDAQTVQKFPETNTDTHEQFEPTYYKLAADSADLTRIFEAIAEQIVPETTVTLGSESVLRDVIKSDDFTAAPGAAVSAKAVKMENGADDTAVTNGLQYPATVPSDGVIDVKGFDYSTLYHTDSHHGDKLVVTITGLIPKHEGDLESNVNAGVFETADAAEAVLTIGSPTLNVAKQSFVIDFNGKMILAREANEPKNATSNNGEFGLEGTSAYYQLRNDGLKASSKDASAVLNSDYDGVDTAMIYGKFDSDTNKQWKQVTAIPASNIYYSDNLTEATLAVNDQIGYNEGVTYVAPTAESANKTYSFTFTGSRIDVYATTTPGTKTVTATLYQNGEKVAEKMVNTKVPTDATRVSAPSVSFDGLSGTYTLEIFANVKANFLLEAVRVYNANEANAEVEPNARYINLRDMVLDKESADELENETPDAVLFMDEVKSENPYQEGTDAYRQYIPQTYEALGPKNEVYLAPGQAIGFEVASGVDVMVSLRSPETESGTVMINGDEQAVTNVDMYYPVTLDDRVVMIRNESEDMISVINVKLTTAEADGSRAMIFSSPKLLARAAQYVAPAAAEVNDEPVIPDFSAIIRQLISDFVRTLFSSISRLFGN